MRWLLALATVLLVGAAPAGAQAKKFVRDEITFARGLATEFGFVGLANEVLEDLLKRKGLDEESLNRIHLEKCNLRILAAQVSPDIQKKRELFGQALDSVSQVTRRFGGTDMANEARLLYTQGALMYGQVLQSLLEDEADPEQRQELTKEAEEVYIGAIKACNDTRAKLESRKDSDEGRVNYYLSWMRQGELEKDWVLVARGVARKTRLTSATRSRRTSRTPVASTPT